MTGLRVAPLGWFVGALTVLGVLVGAFVGWIEAWFIATAGLALLLLALPFLLGARDYRTALRLSQRSVVAGGAVQAAVEVHNVAGRPQLPAAIELPVGDALRELTVPALVAGAQVTLSAEVQTLRRGIIRVGPLTVGRRDPLGMLTREVTWPESLLVHVHPVTVAVPGSTAGLVRDLEGVASSRLTDADLSFHAVREYAEGDPLRHVHWKSTAKTGKLMVRQFEESQSARIAVLVDAHREEYASDDELELGISVAASLSLQAVRDGRERFIGVNGVNAVNGSAAARGSARASVDGVAEMPARTESQLLDAWAALLPATETSARLESLTRGLAESRRPLSLVYVVTGARPSLARIRRAAAQFGPEVRVVVVRSDWLADPAVQRIGALTVCTVGVLSDLPHLMLRGAV